MDNSQQTIESQLENKESAHSKIPTGVWILGFVSLLMDSSSEMIHSLLPVYLVSVLGASALSVGFIEGIAESAAAITKVFSGTLSDYLGKRKLLTALGYGLAALSKPIFPLAPTIAWLVGARFVDRIGKGIRGAPRDAMIADIAPPHLRGASFGLRQSLDTIGAFAGPLLAIAFMWLTLDNFKVVFWIAVIPAVLSFLLIAFAVKEPAQASASKSSNAKPPLTFAAIHRLGGPYWAVLGIGALFTLARFSEAFLILRAQSVGLPLVLAPSVYVLMNIIYALSAYPIGVLSDRVDRATLLGLGLVVLIAADIFLAAGTGLWGIGFGILLWGLHLGMSQGLFAALIADVAPVEQRGTAFGFFNLVAGSTMFLASVIAGILWDRIGASGTFAAGGGFAALALFSLLAVRHKF